MATALVDKKVVTVINSVTLSLTAEEAGTLASILYSIGGDPSVSRRKHAQRIFNALSDAGIPTPPKVDDISVSELSIYFNSQFEKAMENGRC